ncbi:hypothetical protein [Deinococcus arboris]|uniref:hypothetical protein n=1 Tax=Deinococcus arboris TaxID=2682977 RepID=UPI0018DCD323|nr:hypothetical protein [Deinococcus arboris]
MEKSASIWATHRVNDDVVPVLSAVPHTCTIKHSRLTVMTRPAAGPFIRAWITSQYADTELDLDAPPVPSRSCSGRARSDEMPWMNLSCTAVRDELLTVQKAGAAWLMGLSTLSGLLAVAGVPAGTAPLV